LYRTQIPHYGFFILNRQGLEYIQEFLTPECELNVGGEFILFESGQNVGTSSAPLDARLLLPLSDESREAEEVVEIADLFVTFVPD